MLLLTRRAGEEILIDKGRITVKVIYQHSGVVMIGINAPKDIDILRKEVFLRKLVLPQITAPVIDNATQDNLKGMPL